MNIFPGQVTLPEVLQTGNGLRLKTFNDFRRLLDLARKVPAMIDDIIDLLKEGVKENVLYPKEVLSRWVN